MTPENSHSIALFGGVYSNHIALEVLLEDVKKRGISEVYCLGDLGAFGPNPDLSCELIREAKIPVVLGNYDDSIGKGLADCQCGYTDPRDNYFAKLSYDYTFRKTSDRHKEWMRNFPPEIRINVLGKEILLCHGSPRKMNEFIWESTSSKGFIEKLFTTFYCDVIVTTHTGLHWQRAFANGHLFVNCGAIGRPANDGKASVWYTILTINKEKITAEFIPLEYDHEKLATEMRDEDLPEEFVKTIREGWWTTCLEVLPTKERARGRF